MRPIIIFATIMLMIIGVAVAQVPQAINYQGRLTDTGGDPVADGDYEIIFKIWNWESGGTLLWNSGAQTVSSVDGLFSYQLGSSVPLIHSLFTDSTRWLSMEVEGDPEISPRTKFITVPYAYQALRSDTADYAHSGAGSGGDITAVYASGGLSGGGETGDVTLSVDDGGVTETKIASDAVYSYHIVDGEILFADMAPNGAAAGQIMKWDGNQWVAADDETGSGSGGDITAVYTSEGLTGGGETGDVTLSIDDGGVIESKIATNAVTTTKIASNAVTTEKIENSTILFEDIAQNGATPFQVMKWNGASWNAADDETGDGDITAVYGSDGLTGGGVYGDVYLSIDNAGVTETKIANNAVTTGKITNSTILFDDIAQNSATTDQVMKWNGSAWAVADDETGSGGGGWTDDGAIVRLTNTDDLVGIGTTSPQSKLHVNNQYSTVCEMKLANGTTGAGATDGAAITMNELNLKIANLESGTFSLGTSNSTDMIIASSGDVGIGVASPSERLDVGGGSIRTDMQLISTISTGTAPLDVSSQTLVNNLNADMVDGLHASEFGDITSVSPGTGLTGGGSSGDVTLSVSPGGITTVEIANGTIDDDDVATLEPTVIRGTAAVLFNDNSFTGNCTIAGHAKFQDSTLSVSSFGLLVGRDGGANGGSLIEMKRNYNTSSSRNGIYQHITNDGEGELIGLYNYMFGYNESPGGDITGAKFLVSSYGANRYGLNIYVSDRHTISSYSGNSYGIYSLARKGDYSYGIYAIAEDADIDNYAGYFSGDVNVTGTLSKSGGSFKIDHPLDLENKYLQHSFIESPDMMNVYNGNTILDNHGEAVVKLPEYFDALNKDFRYQLTCIGGYAPVYIADEISDNHFRIAGGEPGMKVSWMVTGVRRDAWADANRVEVEIEKPENEKGLYLHPEALGLGPEQQIHYEQNKKALESDMNE